MPLLGGIRPPIAALLCLLMAVAGVTVLALETTGGHDVPQATREAERQIAADAAASVRTSVESDADTLRRSARAYTPTARTTPADALKALFPADGRARGAGLLDPRGGHQLAGFGEPLPLAGVDVVSQARDSDGGPIAARLTRGASAAPRLLLFARIELPVPADPQDANQDQGQDLKDSAPTTPRQWLLVVSETLTVPPVYGEGRGVSLMDVDGRILGGTPGVPGTPGAAGTTAGSTGGSGARDRALPGVAVGAANAASHLTEASGSLLGDRVGHRRTVAGWASVAPAGGKGDTSDLGLTVLTRQQVAVTAGESDPLKVSLEAAGTLAIIALLIHLLLTFALQRPVLRLHLSATRLARAVSDGPDGHPAADDDLLRPVPVPAFGETARIGRALESIRCQLLGERGPDKAPGRLGLGGRALVAVCALMIAGWSLPLLFLANRAHASTVIPPAIVTDQQSRTLAAADRVRQSLGQRYSDLTSLAASISDRTAGRDQKPLRRALDEHDQFRSLYVLNRDGDILLRVGSKPLRTITHTPTGSGITNVNTSGRIPSIAAYAQIPRTAAAAVTADTPVVLFGEIDVHALDRTLSRPALGKVWLTDQEHKVLAANVGFRAFQALPESRLTELAAHTEGTVGTSGSARSAVLTASSAPVGSSSVASAAPLAQTGPAAGLGWRVVSARPAESLRLTAYEVQWRTMLAGLLGLTVGVACLGWLHILAVRPLRALADLAERLAAGDRRTVLYPVNHDEAGSVTRSLELLRQALVARERAAAAAPLATAPARTRTRESAPRT
ncbi:HAMP domain-containing protein [Streptomyces sp. V4-01]|uniref:HAMP domain-containing protein n=1 Tax=Actinacidiphila polyblastidii TaxID=3110430 RepID=A0ABU7PJH6_9ACTN|nr:HAMP domain-containing protein [Streptomyces sp. V4-01]